MLKHRLDSPEASASHHGRLLRRSRRSHFIRHRTRHRRTGSIPGPAGHSAREHRQHHRHHPYRSSGHKSSAASFAAIYPIRVTSLREVSDVGGVEMGLGVSTCEKSSNPSPWAAIQEFKKIQISKELGRFLPKLLVPPSP